MNNPDKKDILDQLNELMNQIDQLNDSEEGAEELRSNLWAMSE